MEPRTVIAAYDATEEAADGLALARLFADLAGAELVVVRVFKGMVEGPGAPVAQQRALRSSMLETRDAVLAVLPDASSTQVVPVLDTRVARGLHDMASRSAAGYVVLGSSHHHGLGRILLGGSAETLVNGSPCPVVVAPPGFHRNPAIEPRVVGIAYDGSPPAEAALGHAGALASAIGAPLRIITVEPSAHPGRPPLVPDVECEQVVLHGDPGRALIHATETGVGLLVTGSRQQRGLKRAMLGSVSKAVMREAHCPLVVVPAVR